MKIPRIILRPNLLFRVGAVAAIVSFCDPTWAQVSKIDYTRDIRPILSNTCFHCHGPDEDARQAELRLDAQEGIISVTSKAADQSPNEFIRRIMSHDADEVMPPADSNKSISLEQRDLLVQWVNQGAKWQQHWAFELPKKSLVPIVLDPNWSKNEIDQFILSRMENAGLSPAVEAAPHTLLRRIYLDLIGLPPTIREADEWLARIWGPDHGGPLNETEWQQLAKQLMASPHYGERWARRWLDLARYADTNGYEKDRDRSIWPYRDWVVNAINDGMPFDRFTIEQLAGDMLPNATVDQKVATGFHRNTMLNEEGGIDPLEFRYNAITDRVATTGTTWLGLTLGCCQCHTHKYDPISHHEYFQVFAFLNNCDEPYLNLPDDSLDQTYEDNRIKANKLLESLPDKWPLSSHRDVESSAFSAIADGNQKLTVTTTGKISVSGESPEVGEYVVELAPSDQAFDSLQLSTFTLPRQPGPGRTAHGNFVLSEIKVESIGADGEWTVLPIASATASVEQSGHEVTKSFDGNSKTGWAIHANKTVPKSAVATFRFDSAILQDLKHERLRITLSQVAGGRHTIGNFRLSLRQQIGSSQLVDLRKREMQEAFKQWIAREQANAVHWTQFVPTEATSNLPILTILDDNSILASGDTAKRDDYSISLAASKEPITAIRLEALPDERLPAGGPGSTYYEGTIGDFYLTELQVLADGQKLLFDSASHTFAKNRYGNNPAAAELAVDGDIQTGWSVHGRQGEKHVAVFVLKKPIPAGIPVQIEMAFGRHFASSLGRFRFSSTNTTSTPVARDWDEETTMLLAKSGADSSEESRHDLLTTFLLSAPELKSESEEIRSLLKYPKAKTTLVLNERPDAESRTTFRHHRGEYLQPKDQVFAALPDVLNRGKANPANRLEFARWLVSGANPLTARVVVNRHWAAFFGTGFVKTVDDFGLQGEYPSHPELLDWLAVTFSKDDDWSIRQLHKRIVCSATYRQSSTFSPEATRVDPDNRLLSFSPRFRLDAEVIRDQLLVAAGVLSPELGGPPVRPLQPDGVTEAAYGKPKWTASSGTARYRRSLYTYAKRTAPFAMFSTFDAPSGEACVARRDRSNSPLQALTLLNDVMLMDLARQAGTQFAGRENSSVENSLQLLFRRILVRKPTHSELQSLLGFYEQQNKTFTTDVTTAQRLFPTDTANATDEEIALSATWTAIARAIFGLDETLTRE